MTVIKRNQIIVLALAIMLIVAGYLNYTYKGNNQFSQEITGILGGKLGEATLVQQEEAEADIGRAEPTASILSSANINSQASQKSNNPAENNIISEQPKKINESDPALQFFAETRLERERVREREVSLHEQVLKNPSVSKEIQEKVQKELSALSQKWEKEMIMERLIKAKGFRDAIVFINQNSVNVMVLSGGSLTPAQVAQIQDIVMREAKVSLNNIKIVAK